MSRAPRKAIRALDLFAGVGGSSQGARSAGVQIVAAVDLWNFARSTYVDNHPGVTFFEKRCEHLDLCEVERQVGNIDLLIASPECTSHTCAKGSGKRSEVSRRTAFQVARFAARLKPRWIVVENVVHMRTWRRFEDWKQELRRLGYHVREQILNAADFGVPQSRKRLFITCDLQAPPPEIRPRKGIRKRPASGIIDANGPFEFSPLRSHERAKPTLERAERAIAVLGQNKPFLLVYYGTDGAGGWQRLDVPLRTITTLDRFAFVRPTDNGHEMRMLQVPELKVAMGFSRKYKLSHGTRRDQIKLLGNAVCPPVMRAVIRSLAIADNGTASGKV